MMLHRVRLILMRQRTQLSNALTWPSSALFHPLAAKASTDC